VLSREGVINVNPWVFIGSVFALKASSDLKPGEYSFQKSASLRDVIATIVEGKVVQHAVTIPEGLTSEQIVARLSDNDIFTGSVREIPREGTLLPETYKFPRAPPRPGDPAHAAGAEARARRDLGAPQSRHAAEIAGPAGNAVVHRRERDRSRRRAQPRRRGLRQSHEAEMKLQSDPTIIYGLVGGKGTLGRPIKRSEITQPSPYNTYVIDGLPPGPIANPGRASLEATATRRAHATCSLLLTAPAATPSPKPTTSTPRTSPSCARWKSRSRTTPSSRR